VSIEHVGDALAQALNYLPDRDELLAEIQRTAIRHLENPTNAALQEHADAQFRLRERLAAKAIELGLIPAPEVERIRSQEGARSALVDAMTRAR
jgi:hypothetical protein